MIRIRGLVVDYGTKRAVDHLDLHVAEGRLFGLLGPNGAGKSTTIGVLGGLVVPTEGVVEVQGIDVARDPIAARRSMGIVPQRLALYPTLSVVDNLRIAGGLFGLGGRRLSERVDWGLATAQLAGRERDAVATLSGGMQRRLNLACALLHDPPLVICDEPTTGVDPQSRNHLFDTVRALHEEGRTVVYTTHYMEEVEALCEEVAVIDHGKLLTSGPLGELVRATGEPTRFELELDAPTDQAALAAALAAAGIDVAELRTPARSLEEVFLELTGRSLRDAP